MWEKQKQMKIAYTKKLRSDKIRGKQPFSSESFVFPSLMYKFKDESIQVHY